MALGFYFSPATPMSAQAYDECIARLRKAGARVVFDGNYRPRAWKGDIQRTRTVFMEALKRVDVALPTFDDEALLWGDHSPEATVERMHAFGMTRVQGARPWPCFLHEPLDTTRHDD